MKLSNWKTFVVVAGVLSAGCQDLVVDNTNNPDRDRALSAPGDVETLAASTFRDLYNRLHSSQGVYDLFTVMGDAFAGTYANSGALELSSEPPVPFNNNPLSDPHTSASRNIWEPLHKGVSSSNDALAAIKSGLKIETGSPVVDNTNRTFIWSKMWQGLLYGHLALIYDRGMIATEDTDLSNPTALEYEPWQDVMAQAFASLQTAIDTATKYNVTIPDTWIPSKTYNSAELVRIMNSYRARFLVYGARRPSDRAQVDWNKVIQYIDAGITQDFGVTLASGVITSGYMSRLQQTGTFSAWGDYKMIGHADVSGNWQAWLAKPIQDRTRFLITTPDRRITGPTPTSSGSYFRYRADNIFRPERGTYHQSHYQWFRNAGRTNSGFLTLMSVDEMRLLKAEALIRLGRQAEAVPLINVTRTRTQRIGTTDHPGLPAVTVTGVTQAADCVPKTKAGACGNLLDALLYERMIETYALDTFISWLDSRGWGRLVPGTFLHLPVPGRELLTLGRPNYSFGGVGGPDAAE